MRKSLIYKKPTFLEGVIYTVGAGHGSTNTTVRRIETSTLIRGARTVTQASTAAAGTTFTILKKGLYAIAYSDSRAAGGAFMGITLNSTQLTTAIESINTANILAIVTSSGALEAGFCAWTGALNAWDVIRAQTDGNMDGTDSKTRFSIFRIG